jgi:anti-sigma factor RsiW
MTATPVLSCREIVELVTDYVEGDLDAATTTALETHLDLCPWCATYVEQIRDTVATLGEVNSANLSAEAQADLLEAFREFHRPVHDRPRGI